MYKECTLAIQKRCNSTQTVASFTVMYMLIKMLFFVCNISHCTIQMYNFPIQHVLESHTLVCSTDGITEGASPPLNRRIHLD